MHEPLPGDFINWRKTFTNLRTGLSIFRLHVLTNLMLRMYVFWSWFLGTIELLNC